MSCPAFEWILVLQWFLRGPDGVLLSKADHEREAVVFGAEYVVHLRLGPLVVTPRRVSVLRHIAHHRTREGAVERVTDRSLEIKILFGYKILQLTHITVLIGIGQNWINFW